MQLIEISWTAGSLDEARKISRKLVAEAKVASAEIIPWIESIYMWDKQLETVQASKIVLKTTLDNFDLVKKIIEENSHYEIPEITFRKIDGVNQEYFDWIVKSIK